MNAVRVIQREWRRYRQDKTEDKTERNKDDDGREGN